MTLQLRPMPLADVQARFNAAELACQKRSHRLRTKLGLPAPASEVDLLTGRVIVWECLDGSLVAGQCTGDCLTGEILSLEVRASHEGRGIGRTLLFHVTGHLRAAGAHKVWLIGPADHRVRAHGFYRAVGCRPTGAQAASGDDILEVPVAPLPRQNGAQQANHAAMAGGKDATALDTSPAPSAGRARGAGRRPANARHPGSRGRAGSGSRTRGYLARR